MKTVIEMAHEAKQYAEYITPQGMEWFDIYNERFAELVRADEREACAKVCEGMKTYIDRHNAVIQSSATDCAAAIRTRGNT